METLSKYKEYVCYLNIIYICYLFYSFHNEGRLNRIGAKYI